MAGDGAPASIVAQLSGMGKVRSAWLDGSRQDAVSDASDRDEGAAGASEDAVQEARAAVHETPKKKGEAGARRSAKKRPRDDAASVSSDGYASGDEGAQEEADQEHGKKKSKKKKKGDRKKKKKKKRRRTGERAASDSGYEEEEESASEQVAEVGEAVAEVGEAVDADAEPEEARDGAAAHVRALEAWIESGGAHVPSLPARKDVAKLPAAAQRAVAEHMADASMRAVLALQRALEVSAALVGGSSSSDRGASHGVLSDVLLHEVETNRALPERRQFVEMGLWRRAHRIATALCTPVRGLLRTARSEEAAAAAEAAATATFADVYAAAFAGTFGDEVERLGEVDGQRLSALLDAVEQSGAMLAGVEQQLMVG